MAVSILARVYVCSHSHAPTHANTLCPSKKISCFYCLYNALHSSIVQIIKLLGPIACRMSGVRCRGVVCPAVGVVTINHAHLLDRPLLVCLSVRLFQNG